MNDCQMIPHLGHDLEPLGSFPEGRDFDDSLCVFAPRVVFIRSTVPPFVFLVG